MRRLVAAGAVVVVVLGAIPALGHGAEVDVVIEAVQGLADAGAVVDYGIALTYADGDPVTDAEVAITTDPPEGVGSDPITSTVPGIWIGRLTFPGTGSWRVTMAFRSAEAEGSVTFTQEVRDPAPQAAVVMVDTIDPTRVGTVVIDSAIIGGGDVAPAVGDHAFAIVAEAFVAQATDPLSIEYAVAATGPDGSPIPGAAVEFEAESDTGSTVPPITLVDHDGIHRGTIRYPDGGSWTVTATIRTPEGSETFTFAELLPWPHYTTEAGIPKVKYDSANPGRIGTLLGVADSIYLAQGFGPTTEPADGEPPAPPIEDPEVVLSLPSPASTLTQDILLRVMHLVALGAWVVPIGAAALGRHHPAAVPVALVGVVGTVFTGMMLALWGSPVAFPGLLRWSELAERLYGPSYQAAFVAKMAFVLAAAAATVWWATRRDRRATWLTLGAVAGAAVAVTAMAQFHLFSHL